MYLTRLLQSFFLAFFLASVGASFAQPQPAASRSKAPDVSELHGKFWRAFEKRDLWEISQLWNTTEPLVSSMFPASGTPAVSWPLVSDGFRKSFSHNRDIKINVRDLHIEQHGDIGWVVSAVRFEAIQTQTGQRVLMDRMLVTEVMERKEGKWKMVHYHAHFPGFEVPGLEPNPSDVIPVPVKLRAGANQLGDDDAMQVLAKFQAAVQDKNIDAVKQLFVAEHPTMLLPRSPYPFIGNVNVAAGWTRSFEEISDVMIEPTRTVLSGAGSDLRWVMEFGSIEMILNKETYKVMHYPVLTTYILKREAAGWRIAHYHSHLSVFDDGHSH